ncbi:Ribosomal RNA small subunit methyltransferase nep-1 [Aphelenchoides fujianensis]|nr:Ribosomal RNA small subunit methyltransferase nep-1 [Aphelenchoides fujianensis]
MPSEKPKREPLDGEKIELLGKLARELKTIELSLTEATFQAQRKLKALRTAQEKRVNSEQVVRYAHTISRSYSVAAPFTWVQGDPSRPFPIELDFAKCRQKTEAAGEEATIKNDVPRNSPTARPPIEMSRKADGANEPPKKRLKIPKEAKKLIVILEDCPLETAQVGREYVILRSDKHIGFLKKHNKDPADYRPDILHQCLLMLLDSPLNKAGLLQVYFRTHKNVLVEVSPQCRLPRTFDRFCGLMVQLLHKMTIRAEESPVKLLNVIKNPITDHLPVGCRKYLMTFNTDTFLKPREFAQTVHRELPDAPLAVVVGGIARGRILTDYTEMDVKVSNYPLSAALTCAKLCTAFEEQWEVE